MAGSSEPEAVAARYARRGAGDIYSTLRPEVFLAFQERQRALVAFLVRYARRPPAELDVLEIGCGSGSNLLELLRLGCDARHLVGNELLSERMAAARRQLPAAIRLYEGDALALPFEPASFDIVYQSMVFSSLLDPDFQERLARRAWDWVRPGGAVLWYDFTVSNPRNPDVRGVPLRRVRELFPEGRVFSRRVTLAPPLSRILARVHPELCRLVNLVAPLRTHRLCWIRKDAAR